MLERSEPTVDARGIKPYLNTEGAEVKHPTRKLVIPTERSDEGSQNNRTCHARA